MNRSIPAVLALAALASACAASTGGPVEGPPSKPTTVVEVNDGPTSMAGLDAELQPDNIVTARVVAAPPATAWPAAEQAYLKLGIPVTTFDSNQRVIGNTRFTPGRRFLNQPMSYYVNCGIDQMGASLADTYAVTLELRTVLAAAPGNQTEVRTTLAGSARQRSGATNSSVRCTSRGVLEQRIATAIQLELAGTGS